MNKLVLLAGCLGLATIGCVDDTDYELELDFGAAFDATSHRAQVVTLDGQAYVSGCIRGWLGCTAALPDLAVGLDNVVIDVPPGAPLAALPDGLVLFDFPSFPGEHLLVARAPIVPIATVTIAGVEAVGALPAAPVLRGPTAPVSRTGELVIAVDTAATDGSFAGSLVSTCAGQSASRPLDPAYPEDGIRFAPGELGLELSRLTHTADPIRCTHAITLWTRRELSVNPVDAVGFTLLTAAATQLVITSEP